MVILFIKGLLFLLCMPGTLKTSSLTQAGNFCTVFILIALVSIFNAGTFKFKDTYLIPQLKLSLQSMTNMGYQ